MDFNDYTYPRDDGFSVLDWFGDPDYAKPKWYATPSECSRIANALRCEVMPQPDDLEGGRAGGVGEVGGVSGLPAK